MKKILAISTLVVFGGFAQAQDTPKAAAKKCPASACPASCADGCCGTMVKLAVTGLDDEATAATAKVKIGAMAGVTSFESCAKSGTVMVKYNPETMKSCDVEKAVAANGLKVVGHKTAMKVKGLACQSCSNHLTSVLGKTEGVVNVDKVCHQSGTVMVTFDPKKTDLKKIKESIHTTKYKVVEDKAKKAADEPVAQS